MCVYRDSKEMLEPSLLMHRLANALADANARTQFYQVVDPNKMPLYTSLASDVCISGQ